MRRRRRPPSHPALLLQDAHRIVVVQGGAVVETGTHDQLLESGGTYAHLVRRQLARSTSTASLGPASSSYSSLPALR